jgi:predicted amidophosphoribosyltransferase
MSLRQRRKVVAGAFAVDESAELEGRTVVLVDDVLTTGSTANACARALKRAGAERVELVSWARVIKPMQLT